MEVDGVKGWMGPGEGVGRPGFAVVSVARVDDGIARVVRLYRRSLREAAGSEPLVTTLDRSAESGFSGMERACFASRVFLNQVNGRVDWLLFDHVATARVQALIPGKFRKPFGVVLHGIEAWQVRRRRGEVAALRAARLLLAVSSFTARRTAALYPELGPVLVCPSALEPAEIFDREEDRELLRQVQADSVLIVGRMVASERYKGHDELLAAWPSVLAYAPSAQLVVVGRGDDLGRLRRKAARLGLGDSVLFTGFVDEATLAELRRRVKVFAMPSRGEGFGLVYLEAMRAALPCIASSADAGAEVVLHEKTGLVVEPTDRAALADALVRLLLDEDLRRAYGEAGRRRYEQEFTFEAFQRRFVPILIDAFGA